MRTSFKGNKMKKPRNDITDSHAKQSTLFQVGTYTSLVHGVYHGEYTFAELAKHGDFGLGTFDGINGEMAAFDGVFYKLQEDGILKIANPDDITPFANVTFFNPTEQLAIQHIKNFEHLIQTIETNLTNKNVPHALRFDAHCDYVNFSIVRGQKKPYPPITEVQKTKIIEIKKDIAGTMIGFWIPKYFSPVAKTGLHLRFITENRTTGGQLHDIALKQATIHLQPLHKIEIYLPFLEDFSKATF